MNNTGKLETLIYKIIDECHELREERDKAIKNAENSNDELRKAQEAIKKLEGNREKIGNVSNVNDKIEDQKNEIIRQIKSVITRVNKLKINNITNV